MTRKAPTCSCSRTAPVAKLEASVVTMKTPPATGGQTIEEDAQAACKEVKASCAAGDQTYGMAGDVRVVRGRAMAAKSLT